MRKIILVVILLCLVVTPCYAAKGFFIVKMSGGSPMLGDLPYKGFLFIGSQVINKVQYGAYKISGTPEQLAAIATSPNVLQVAPSKESLTKTVTSKAISDTTPFLSAKAVPLKETSTREEMVNTIFKSFHEKFDMNMCDVVGEAEDEADYKAEVKPVDGEVIK